MFPLCVFCLQYEASTTATAKGKENDLGKKNSRSFKPLCNCSNLLNLSDVTELSGAEFIVTDGFQVQIEKGKVIVECSHSPQNQSFDVVLQGLNCKDQNANATKMQNARAEALFSLTNLIVLCRSRCPICVMARTLK